MIYILSGNDTKKKNAYLKKLSKNDQPVFISEEDINKEMLFDYANSVTLFGTSSIVVVENVLKEKEEGITLSVDELSVLKDSQTNFVFLEDKLLAPGVKKYKKYATIEDFNTQVLKQKPKMNVFDIAEAFSRKDKIGAWVLYREAVSLSTPPEEISGIIFWKIKTMLLNGTKFFSIDELKSRSSEIVSIYHKAHRGECDFTIGLEQFILSSLSK
jgi:DNA polymerase III delta subunit